MKHPSLTTLVLLLLVLLPTLAAYVSSPPLHYRGTEKISWEKGVPCGKKDGQPLICYNSKEIPQKGSVIDLEYQVSTASSDLPPAILQVFTKGKLLAAEFSLETKPDFYIASWGVKRLTLPPGESISLRLSRTPKVRNLLRTKIAFWEQGSLGSLFSLFSTFEESKEVPLLLLFVLALSLSAILVNPSFFRLSHLSFFMLLLFISFFLHFRTQCYFYYDEWRLFERFSTLGLRGAFYSHNEHFLPLFFAFYFLEAKLFKGCYAAYLCVSLLLHALNALLLSLSLEELLNKIPGSRQSSRILGMLFLISALHTEVLQWPFVQCLLISQFLFFVLLLSAVRFVRYGNKLCFVLALLSTLVGPFFFGNAFIIPLQIAPLLLVLVVAPLLRGLNSLEEGEPETWINNYSKLRLVRSLLLIFLLGACLAPPAYFYLENKEIVGHGVDEVRPFDDPEAAGEYLLTGSQLGSILRATSLYPSLLYPWLKLDPAKDALIYLPAFLKARISNFSYVTVFFAYVGLAFSALLACVYLIPRSRIVNISLFLLGQIIILLSFTLPALSRWQYGAPQALSPRYQYNAWFGLALILLPIFLHFFRMQLQGPLNWKKKGLFVVLVSGLTLHIFSQLYLGAHFRFFTEHGARNRRYVLELEAWEQKRSAQEKNGEDKTLSAINPIYPEEITLGFYPEDIYAVYKWLKRE